MKINEVETLTGLSAKTIRFYEDKGLIQVARLENGYRDYTQEDVRQLKSIQLYRQLEFSIQEIAQLLHASSTQWETQMIRKGKELENTIEIHQDKQELFYQLLKTKGELGKIIELTEHMEPVLDIEEDIKKELIKIERPSFWVVCIWTLVWLGPIVRLLMTDDLTDVWGKALVGLSFLSVSMMTLLWRNYLHQRKNYRLYMKEANENDKMIFPMMLLSILGGLASFVLIDYFIQILVLPNDWLFYDIQEIWGLVLITYVEIFWLLLLLSWGKRDREKSFWTTKRLHSIGMFIVGLSFFMWQLIASITYFTPTSIVTYTQLGTTKQVYSYEDVTMINTGFYQKRWNLPYQAQGMFYYELTLPDKKIVLTQPSVNSEIKEYEDSYSELEALDERLMSLNIKKDSSEEGVQWNDLDSKYTNRFLRIIRNQP